MASKEPELPGQSYFILEQPNSLPKNLSKYSFSCLPHSLLISATGTEHKKKSDAVVAEIEVTTPSTDTSESRGTKYTQKLQFISGRDEASRKLARSHMVREILRKKRFKDLEQQKHQPQDGIKVIDMVASTQSEQKGRSKMTPNLTAEANPHHQLVPALARKRPSVQPTTASAKESIPGIENMLRQPYERGLSCTLLQPPASLIGPGSRDLFSALPVNEYSKSDILTGDYLSMLAYQMFGASVRSDFNPFRDIIFKIAIEDPPSFEVIVALAAAHNDALHKRDIGAETALHKMKALRLINDRLTNAEGNKEDGTIFTIAALWCLEVHYGNEKAIQSHIAGLRQIIINRGGLDTLGTNPRLQMIIMWCILTLPGVMTFGSSVMLEDSSGVSKDNPPERSLEPCRRELINFFDEVHRLAISPSSPYPAESFAFQSGLPLQRLLSGPCQPREGQYRLTVARDLQAICRLAILLYIHTIFLDYHALPDIIKTHLKKLRARIVEHELDRNLSIESIELLLWILFKDEAATRIDDISRTWRVARMMSVAKSTSRQWLVSAGELLFSYLRGQPGLRKDVDAVLAEISRCSSPMGYPHWPNPPNSSVGPVQSYFDAC